MLKISLLFIFLYSLLLTFSQPSNKDSVLVFVGEKIDVYLAPPYNRATEPIPTYSIQHDTAFIIAERSRLSDDITYIAKYKILELVRGYYQYDTITFTVYDHYGYPKFANQKEVLLFVLPYRGKFFHIKYQFFTVFKTKSGRWASDYFHIYQDYHRKSASKMATKLENITFEKELRYNLRKWNKKDIDTHFPTPYYTLKRKKATAIYGNYVEDLVDFVL